MKVFKVDGYDDPPRKPFILSLFDGFIYVATASLVVIFFTAVINELWGWVCGIQF